MTLPYPGFASDLYDGCMGNYVTRRIVLRTLLAAAPISLAAGCGFGDRIADAVAGPESEDNTEVVLEIPLGSTTEQIANQLRDAGVIRSALAFRMRARQSGLDGSFQAGQHVLRRNMSVDEAIQALQKAEVRDRALTLIEGWRREEIAAYLQTQRLLNASEFLALTLSANFERDFLADLPATSTLEGFLFPDTYRIENETTTTQFIESLLDQFSRKIDGGVDNGFQANGLSTYQAVTLAAIVEREAQVAAERPVIASVFYNRLRIGMPLQADPTVQYALGYQESEGRWWKRALTYDDLRVASPFNTYANAGLPPGPICNPGLASLQAVSAPATTDYYYFVAVGDGSHVFSRTLDEHNANVRKYQSS